MSSEQTNGDALRRRRELGSFLRYRRLRLRPEQVGIVASGRRHIKGLRREEVAELAGISCATYVALEQGRIENVTQRTISRVCDVLRLDTVERDHVTMLASPGRLERLTMPSPGDAIIAFVRTYPLGPAHMHDASMDVLAWNGLADQLFNFSGFERPNLLVSMIEHRPMRENLISPNWETTLARMMGTLRLLVASHPSPRTSEVLERLGRDATFARHWAEPLVELPPMDAPIARYPQGLLQFQLLPFQSAWSPANMVMLTTSTWLEERQE